MPAYNAGMSEQNLITVDVETDYIESESSPDENRYVFSYTITIKNEGETPARLLTRHWVITDSDGRVQEVKGDGVVGEHPHLQPGEGFRYTSGTILETPVGSMQGTYQMMSDEGEEFDAQIDPFRLSIPSILH